MVKILLPVLTIILLFHSPAKAQTVWAEFSDTPFESPFTNENVPNREFYDVIIPCPTDAGTISGNQSICIGATSSFTSTATGGAWSSSNTAIATVNALTGLITGASAGTATITYTIAGSGSCTTVSASRTITVLAVSTFNTRAITICPNGSYQITLTTASPNANGWSSTGGGLSISDAYVTAGSTTGTGTVFYTDGCGVTISATVNITPFTTANSITSDRVGAHRFDGNPQGPLLTGTTINHIGYAGYTFYSQSRPSEVGQYRANIQSGGSAGCPSEYYIFNCTTCEPSASQPTYTAAPFICGSNLTFYYNGGWVTYGTVTSTTGECWLDRNLGATRVATASTDFLAYGDLFQWGRGDDGHQTITWTSSSSWNGNSSITTLSNTDQPGHKNFIRNNATPFDWRSPKNDNLWQGGNGINNPCPSGWRLPTLTELNAEILTWTNYNSAGAFSSPLKLTEAKSRSNSSGAILLTPIGNYWSSTVNAGGAESMSITSAGYAIRRNNRALGYSVRCIKE